MGTINYKTSEYITLSIMPYDADDIRQGIIDNITSGEYDGLTVDQVTDDFVNDEIQEHFKRDQRGNKGSTAGSRDNSNL